MQTSDLKPKTLIGDLNFMIHGWIQFNGKKIIVENNGEGVQT